MANEYFFTFGANHVDNEGISLGQRYVKIEAESELEAREIMFRARGEKWAFVYDATDFAGQEERYGLHEIDIYSAAFMRI